MSELFQPLDGSDRSSVDAAAVVRQIGVSPNGEGVEARRPRVVAAMISGADGRAAIDGRAGGLGGGADRALLRELRCCADAVLVGPSTLVDEQYSTLLDEDHRQRRLAAGLSAEPIAATISRRLDQRIAGLRLLAVSGQKVVVYTQSSDQLVASGADLTIKRSAPGELTLGGCLENLYSEHGVRTIVSEGGPTLLYALAAERLIDDFVFTDSPLLVGGAAPPVLDGPAFEPPLALGLQALWRSGSFLFLHYTPLG